MNFSDWQSLTEEEQREIAREWTPYTRGIGPLLNEITKAFRASYPHLEIRGIGNVFGNLMLVVLRPFIFDKRAAPDSFMGLNIRYTLTEQVPDGFDVNSEYVWAPENYLTFVDNHASRIRAELGEANMNREEMLEALIGMPFDDWIERCHEFGPGHTRMVPGQRQV